MDEDGLLPADARDEEEEGSEPEDRECDHRVDVAHLDIVEVRHEDNVALEVEHHQLRNVSPQSHLRVKHQVDVALVGTQVGCKLRLREIGGRLDQAREVRRVFADHADKVEIDLVVVLRVAGDIGADGGLVELR